MVKFLLATATARVYTPKLGRELAGAYLDAAASLLLEKNVLRLHVAMDDLVLVESVEALQQRVREPSHQLHAEALELVLLDQLVQVDAEQLEGDAHVVTEGERVEHVDDVHGVVLVLLPQLPQYPYLLLRLSMEPLLVPHHLQGDVLVHPVVVRLHHLAERAPADHLQHLVPVRHVIVDHVYVGTLLVVVVVIVRAADDAGPLLRVRAYEVYLGIEEDLLVLVRRQLVHVHLHHKVGRDHDRLRLAAAVPARAPVRPAVLHHQGGTRLPVRLRVRIVAGLEAGLEVRPVAGIVRAQARVQDQIQALRVVSQAEQAVVRAGAQARRVSVDHVAGMV